MDKWNLIIDVARCENCNNCALATKDEHIGNDFPGYAAAQPERGHDWIRIERKVRGQAPMVDCAYLPVTCNHCDEAPCVKASTNGAAYQRPDGIVIIDPEKAKGQRQIMAACPYGAISWNDEKNIPQKWIFDAHLLDQGWKQPRAVQSCPTGAMRAVKVDDAAMQEMVRAQSLRVLKPERGTRPRVYYRNLHRFDSAFVGGTVLASVDGVEDCVEGAQVALLLNGKSVASAKTDAFGDFKFDALVPGAAGYRVQALHPRHGQCEVSVDLAESRYAGALRLQATSSRKNAAGTAATA